MESLKGGYVALIRRYGKKRTADLFNGLIEKVDRDRIEVSRKKFAAAGLPFGTVFEGETPSKRATKHMLRRVFGEAMRYA